MEDIKAAFANPTVMDGLGRSLYDKKHHPLFNEIQIHTNYANCIFSSAASIELMKKYLDVKERFFLMDGTFRITPNGIFNQVLILYIRIGTKVRTICIH